VDGFVIRRAASTDAQSNGERFRAIFRDAVLAAAPGLYTPDQVVAWARGADHADRWTPWLVDGATWIAATTDAPDRPVAFAIRHPADHLNLLFVDPTFHRRGLGRALLEAAANEARDEGVVSLVVEASLISHPLFARAGYDVAAWEDVEVRGQVFRRAVMRKVLR
jgi:putative acetyltransferase